MLSKGFSALLGVLAVAALGGCSSTAEEPMAASVRLDDSWVRATDSGMTAMFGMFENSGGREAHVVGAESPTAGLVEIHEIAAGADGSNIMQQKPGGITIPPGGAHELVPGGDHLMLMDLKRPLRPGEDVEVTVMFDDGSALPITAQIRDFAGGDEEYSPGTHAHG